MTANWCFKCKKKMSSSHHLLNCARVLSTQCKDCKGKGFVYMKDGIIVEDISEGLVHAVNCPTCHPPSNRPSAA